MGPAGGKWERAGVHLSASQHCVSGEEKLVYPTKEVYGTFLFMLTIKRFKKLETVTRRICINSSKLI